MKVVPAAGETCKGIDVSHWNGQIDLIKAKSGYGLQFCYSKCTEYNYDNTYGVNRKGAALAGILFGGYHFFHPSRDPIAQAELFLKWSAVAPGDLLPILDWEATDGLPSQNDRERGWQWIQHIQKQIGKYPIIYGSPYFLQALALDERFKQCALMIAEYQVSAPKVPSPWNYWSFWQYSERGNIPGILSRNVDLDLFNGSLDQLKKMVV